MMCCLSLHTAHADAFKKVSYDAATDEIVIVVQYRGTNPDHDFTLTWDSCRTGDDGNSEIGGELLDQQARDRAEQDFTKTVRFSVADLDCRPATATIRTAPRFLATVRIPAPSAATRR
jgi:hypothetical protein